MKKLLYTILLSLGTFLFTACTDYINVDKYFYDQVSLDSAFSKRVYVEGWLSSAYSVMDNDKICRQWEAALKDYLDLRIEA